jgi:hypothetical protein
MSGVDLAGLEARIAGTRARYVGLVRVKNECDVIESFVRYHLRLFDHLVVLDNVSQDATATIVDLLIEEGLPVTLVRDETLEFRQSDVMTYAARTCFSSFACDRLFLLDADEFVHIASRIELDRAFSLISGNDHALIGWQTYVPLASDPDDPALLRRITHRRANQKIASRKLVLSRTFIDQPAAHVAMGNHEVVNGDGRCVDLPDVALAHFPIRSIEQLQIKAALSWNSYLAMGYETAKELGHQWHDLSNAFLFDRDALSERLGEVAYGYTDPPESFSDDDLIHDPLAWHDQILYERQSRPDPLATITAAGRAIARRYGSLRSALDAANISLAESRARLARLEDIARRATES